MDPATTRSSLWKNCADAHVTWLRNGQKSKRRLLNGNECWTTWLRFVDTSLCLVTLLISDLITSQDVVNSRLLPTLLFNQLDMTLLP
jgi:hypothetical protein